MAHSLALYALESPPIDVTSFIHDLKHRMHVFPEDEVGTSLSS